MLNRWHWGRSDTVWACFFCGFPNRDRHEMCERCGCEKVEKQVKEVKSDLPQAPGQEK